MRISVLVKARSVSNTILIRNNDNGPFQVMLDNYTKWANTMNIWLSCVLSKSYWLISDTEKDCDSMVTLTWDHFFELSRILSKSFKGLSNWIQNGAHQCETYCELIFPRSHDLRWEYRMDGENRLDKQDSAVGFKTILTFQG